MTFAEMKRFPAQPHIMYHHPGSSALTTATTPPAATFLPSATPAGLLLTPPSAFYSDYDYKLELLT
ncbi:hypothetical protein DERP_005738 [Dermatophagoides pteronyssinus]|uniref:Uncharacterized protein n=1 Tax=Dermatophagoides pteronyssinus TaxID=6956 RepID=A0ABQ8JA23_DERPT|nr:hypothetical protein DERP_005738 [Dermatophagoides pteronyssinus]